MARSIYGADGSAQVVSPTGIPTVAAATVYSARTGGSVVTDIQNMAGLSLGGVVTPDARGQIIFQGPDATVSTFWLDFGDGGQRWGVKPVDVAGLVSAAITANDLAQYTTPSGFSTKSHLPYITNTPIQALVAAMDGLIIPRFATSGARDAAYPAPADGDRVYRTDLHAHQTYRALSTPARWVTDHALIQEQVLAADAATITFASIPQEWRNLVIKYRSRMVGSIAASTITSYLGIRFNSDTGTNYAQNGHHRLMKGISAALTYEVARDGTGGGATTAAAVFGSMSGGVNNFVTVNATSAYIGIIPGSSNAAGLFGGGEIQIDDYTNATTRKSVIGHSGYGDNVLGTGTGYSGRADIVGGWSNNAAITNIALIPASGTAFASGSSFRLYGWS